MKIMEINLSEFLKEKRQSQNISLERLSELTKIQIYHLEALEGGHFEKLPPSIYRDGIFKRLSKFLDADENEILTAYKNGIESKTFTAQSRAADMDFQFKTDLPNSGLMAKRNYYFILTPKKLSFFLGGLFLTLLSSYLWYQFNFLIGPPNLAIEPKEDMTVQGESILINGKTDNGVDLTINGESLYVASNGSFSKEVKLAAGINIIEIKAINNFGKITKIIRQIFREAQQ